MIPQWTHSLLESNNFLEEYSKFERTLTTICMECNLKFSRWQTQLVNSLCRLAWMQLGAFKCSNRAMALWLNRISVNFSLTKGSQDAITSIEINFFFFQIRLWMNDCYCLFVYLSFFSVLFCHLYMFIGVWLVQCIDLWRSVKLI